MNYVVGLGLTADIFIRSAYFAPNMNKDAFGYAKLWDQGTKTICSDV